MNLGEAIKEVRGRLDDSAAPFLWSQELLTSYIVQAEIEAAIRAKLLYDRTTARVCEIPLAVGTSEYKLHESIFDIDRVALASTGRKLDPTFVADEDEDDSRWSTRTGSVCRFIDHGKTIQVIRIPTVVDTLKLSVWRKPLCAPKEDRDCFEIGHEHHERMLDWALHLAYLKRDSDTFDQAKADDYEGRFTASFGIRETANVYRKRRLRRPTVVKAKW